MTFIILVLNLISLISPQIKIENAWMRNADKGMNTALYLDIINPTSRAYDLVNVSSDIAKVVQIHETYKQGDNLGMRKVESITIKGMTTFHLAPGGFHVMVIRLKENLKVGDKKEFILTFSNHLKIKIMAVVKDQ
ncbi:MAG: copper chaperone PCu(A)C [Ignavibacteriaceae bacterium]|nr:copper chaperone PCu(A)C [Ignavibacteriaceae bacterium]